MTTKDFLRRRTYYSNFILYVCHNYPSAPLYDVSIAGEGGLCQNFYTFSQKLDLSYPGLISVCVQVVSEDQFNSLRKRFISFVNSCSASQRASLFKYYSDVCQYDFDSFFDFWSFISNK